MSSLVELAERQHAELLAACWRELGILAKCKAKITGVYGVEDLEHSRNKCGMVEVECSTRQRTPSSGSLMIPLIHGYHLTGANGAADGVRPSYHIVGAKSRAGMPDLGLIRLPRPTLDAQLTRLLLGQPSAIGSVLLTAVLIALACAPSLTTSLHPLAPQACLWSCGALLAAHFLEGLFALYVCSEELALSRSESCAWAAIISAIGFPGTRWLLLLRCPKARMAPPGRGYVLAGTTIALVAVICAVGSVTPSAQAGDLVSSYRNRVSVITSTRVSFTEISLERGGGLKLPRLVIKARNNKATDADLDTALAAVKAILDRKLPMTVHYDVRDVSMVLSASQLWKGIAFTREHGRKLDALLQCISATLNPGLLHATVSFFIRVNSPPQPVHVGTDEAAALHFVREHCRVVRDWKQERNQPKAEMPSSSEDQQGGGLLRFWNEQERRVRRSAP